VTLYQSVAADYFLGFNTLFAYKNRIKTAMIPSYKKTFLLVWPLMLAILMIMIGNGLQGTLLGLRANAEDFPVFVTGLVMSLYYLGFVIGCMFVPKIVSSVGHVRVFAAMASIASSTILFHGMFIDPWIWGGVRVISGIAFAGLFIVAESWLNNIATNKLRAQIFSTYISVIYVGQFAGQFIVDMGALDGLGLFVVVSVLISLSLLPVTLANKPTPGFEEPEALPFKNLMAKSPLATASVFTTGFCVAAVLGIGSVYASEMGMSTREIAIFIAAFIAGNASLPLITGWISDQMDRRTVIIASAFVSMVAALCVNIHGFQLLAFFVFGGMTMSVYSISIAYMNDQIKPEQIVSATTSLILLGAIGSCLGPLVMGGVMSEVGPESFFYVMAGASGFILLVGIWRTIVGRSLEARTKYEGDFMVIPSRSSPMAAQIPEDD
jgi:MFS family permease